MSQQPSIIVYSKADCMPCQFTKNFLNDNNVVFEERNTTEHPEYIEAAKAYGFLALPVVIISGGHPFSGFQPDRLAKLL